MNLSRAILLTCAAIACALPSHAQNTGDVQLGVKSSSGPLEPFWITKTANKVIGWNSSGVLGPITLSGGGGSSDWADITSKPTTLTGYGITDSITATLAAATYQPLIADGTLSLGKLSTNPLDRANHTGTQAWSTIASTPTTLAGYGITDSITAALAASTYQPIIADGTLPLTKLATNPLARANHTGTQAWSTITSTPTTLAGYGITDSITAALAASTYQPLAANLTTLSALANAAGVLINNGAGVLSYAGTTTGGNGVADDGKLLQFRSNGSVCVTDEVQFNSSGNPTVVSLLRSTGSIFDASIYLPTASGDLALTSDITLANLGGLGTGLPAALALNVGSAGAPVLFNGAGGTPSTINLSNASNLPLASGVTGDLPFANLTQASAASKLLGRGAASGAGDLEEITLGTGLSMTGKTLSASGGGKLSQVVYTSSSTPASTTATFPGDNTIPQNTEGAALSALDTTITPTNAGSTLLVRVVVSCGNNAGIHTAVALFRDNDADAIQSQPIASQIGSATIICFEASVPANSTSATTFKIRYGGLGACTMYVNTYNGTQYLGGATKSTISVTEILP
ncbi:MAG: virulence factor Pgp3 [Prosthecobacter sp.]